MFKIEMSAVPTSRQVGDVIRELSEQAGRDICEIVPLAEVTLKDLPTNGCSQMYGQHQYAEALVLAARAHFAFVQFDRRLIYTRSVCPAGKADGSARLLYVFNYLETPAERAEPTVVKTSASKLGDRNGDEFMDAEEEEEREGDSLHPTRPGTGVNIEAELAETKQRLDRAERQLLEISQHSAEVDLALPSTPPVDLTLPVPRISLGSARDSILGSTPSTGSSSRSARTASRSTTATSTSAGALKSDRTPAVSRPTAAASSSAGRSTSRSTTVTSSSAGAVKSEGTEEGGPVAVSRAGRKRRAPTPTERQIPVQVETASTDQIRPPSGRQRRGSTSASSVMPVPQKPPPSLPAPVSRGARAGRKSLHLTFPPDQVESLLEFYHQLNAANSQQSRVALTCRYARLRFSQELSSEALYHLLSSRGSQGSQGSQGSPPPALSAEGERSTALAIYQQLDPSESQQTRVAFTLKYMAVQYQVRIDSKTLFSWLEQGAAGAKKRARKSVARV